MRTSRNCRVLVINGRRTSMRLEAIIWDLLAEVEAREGLSVCEIISRLETEHKSRSGEFVNLASVVRLYVMTYFRAAATEEGHRLAGHGRGDPLPRSGTEAPEAGGADKRARRPRDGTRRGAPA